MRVPLSAAALALIPLVAFAQAAPPGAPSAFDDLPGFSSDDLAAALTTFRVSCGAVLGTGKPVRAALAPPTALRAICYRAAKLPHRTDEATARAFFTSFFTARRLEQPAFLTGYFEPVVDGALVRSDEFAAPLLAAPATGGPLPDRAAIEAGALGSKAPPLVWLRRPVDAFFVAVQGSARVRLRDGTLKRVAFAGRNGQPYTSVGKLLVQRLGIPPSEMGMAQLRSWIEQHGQAPGEEGRRLMDENRSFIFFRFDDSLSQRAGPVGAEGVSVTPLRSLAVDRTQWAYGLPIYVDADLPWQGDRATPFRRLMVTQDTGAAIIGPARADIFFGTGDDAAARSGVIRHPGTMWVLWPKDRVAPPSRTAADR